MCKINPSLKRRTVLISLYYSLNKEQIKEQIFSKELIEKNYYLLEFISTRLILFNEIVINLKKNLLVDDVERDIIDLDKELNPSKEKIKDIIILWESGMYGDATSDVEEIDLNLLNISENFYELNKTINDLLIDYNNIVNDLITLRNGLKDIDKTNVTFEKFIELNSFVTKFNDAIGDFNNKTGIEPKKELVRELKEDFNLIYPIVNNSEEVNLNYSLSFNLSEIYLENIYLDIKEKKRDFNYGRAYSLLLFI